MARIRVAASAVIDAPADVIYEIISDYKNGHQLILPKENFRDLVVEEGGKGEGTVIRFVTRAGGQDRHFHARVAEPEPGRVLAEHDLDSDLVTTFTLTPLGENQTRVQIATEQSPSKGIRGFVEQRLGPRLLMGIYEKELQQLAELAAGKNAASQASQSTG